MFGRSRKEKAKRIIAAVTGGDVEAVRRLVTEDFVFVDSRQVELRGRDTFLQFVERFAKLDLDVRIEYGELGVSGDQILMSGDQTARDERLTCRIQWQISFRRSRACRIQTFRGDEPVSIVRAVEKYGDGPHPSVNTPQAPARAV